MILPEVIIVDKASYEALRADRDRLQAEVWEMVRDDMVKEEGFRDRMLRIYTEAHGLLGEWYHNIGKNPWMKPSLMEASLASKSVAFLYDNKPDSL
jgi:hypothetical protein